ncbi:hypothetical protein JYU34_004339 [Plutella xylostella]|uniref:Modifier of mdg4 n=1 Tax=Plutella xylostella TaxID=51655 RepID=A0ABQ7QXQ1_PLUXY|nr:hypothetical protein JYU34_004339 [Plutella xylostella]
MFIFPIKHSAIKSGRRYRCTVGCKAHVYLTQHGALDRQVHEHSHPPPVYTRTANGLAIFTVNRDIIFPIKHSAIKSGRRYRCTVGCKAHVYLTQHGALDRQVHEHSHPPPVYTRTANGLNSSGRQRYRCSAGCPAHVYLDNHGTVEKLVSHHTHAPEVYEELPDGQYVRAKTKVPPQTTATVT